MMRKGAIIIIVWCATGFCLVSSAEAQVSPDRISDVLMKKSIAAVTGTEAYPEWKAYRLESGDRDTLDPLLKQKANLPDTVYVGILTIDGNTRYIIPDIAPSKSKTFSYLLYLDPAGKIMDVDILKYRENYGYEIDYSYFRKQFRGKSEPGDIIFGRTIQNISGATISARSVTNAVHDLIAIFNRLEVR